MNMPRFTAEDSLYKTSGHYQTSRQAINLPTQTIGAIHLATIYGGGRAAHEAVTRAAMARSGNVGVYDGIPFGIGADVIFQQGGGGELCIPRFRCTIFTPVNWCWLEKCCYSPQTGTWGCLDL
jgi:hypothetical protein